MSVSATTNTEPVQPAPTVLRFAACLRARARTHLLGLAAILWSASVLAVQGSRLGRWIVDDAGISFAYARSFALGHGPVVQAGAAPVEGYSNPTWVALLTLGRLLGLFDHGAWFGVPDYVLFPKALGLLCAVGILLCFYAAACSVFGGRSLPALVTAAAGTVLAFVPTFVVWTVSGLENPLYALLITALAVLFLRAAASRGASGDRLLTRRTAVAAGLLVAAAGLTRPDGVIYLAAYPGVVLVTVERERLRGAIRPVAESVAAFAVPYGAYLVWRRLEFHRWVPNTAVAKHQDVPSLNALNRIAEVVQYPGAAASSIGAVIVVAAMAGIPRVRRPLAALAVPLVLALVAFCTLGPDWMAQLRFSTPFWPLAVLVVAIGAAAVLTRIPWREQGLRLRAGVAVALAGSLYLAADTVDPIWSQVQHAPTVPLCVVAAHDGELFNDYADIAGVRRGSLLLPDLGGTALTSRLNLRDMAGLVDAPVADFYRRDDTAGLGDYIYDTMQPTFIQAHGYWSAPLETRGTWDPRLLRDYVEIYPAGAAPPDPMRSSDWVRKSALQDPADLAKLRAYARTAVPALDRKDAAFPLGTCPGAFHVGQGLPRD